MKIVQRLLILFAFFGIAGCNQQLLRPFDPTGNPETEPAPEAVPTLPPEPLPPENAIQFLHEEVEPGESVPFIAEGYNAKEELKVKITRPDGTEVEYSAYADGYGVLEGTVSVAPDRPLGVYTVTITGQSYGHEATGWFTVTAKKTKTITGTIVKIDEKGKTIRVEAIDGRTETLKVTDETEDENGDPVDFDGLHEGDQVKVEYNPRTEEATEIEKLN